MILFLFFASIYFCLLSYLNMDPMKSCFFLIFSVFTSVSFFSVFYYTWMSYFIILLFMSGIFVILVYVSSFSKLDYYMPSGGMLCVFFSCFLFFFSMVLFFFLGLEKFFFLFFLFYFFWLFYVIYFFLVFSCFYLNFLGALRKFNYFFIF